MRIVLVSLWIRLIVRLFGLVSHSWSQKLQEHHDTREEEDSDGSSDSHERALTRSPFRSRFLVETKRAEDVSVFQGSALRMVL